MATGDDEPDPGRDDEPDPDGDDGPVLSPEELDITDDEHVQEIEEGRFVVSPEGRPADPAPGPAAVTGGRDGADSDSDSAEVDAAEATATETLDEATVHEWLRERMAASSSRYGFDVTGSFDGSVSNHRIASNDIVTVFETMLLWYARQVDSETPVEEVIGILLMESNVPVRYPAASLQTLLDSVDVDEDDSIADLIDAVETRDGIQL